MSDWYRDFANSGFGTTVTEQLGLPRPAVLRRYEPGGPLLHGHGGLISSTAERWMRDGIPDGLLVDIGRPIPKT